MKHLSALLALLTALVSAPLPAAAGGCPEKDPGCREVSLTPPAGPRFVSFMQKKVRLRFDLAAVIARAKKRRGDELVAYLAQRKEADIQIALDELPTVNLHNELIFIAAALLEEGQASLYDTRTKTRAKRVIVQPWNWIGCAGGCRQAGRAFRLAIPGKPFFRTTDLYEDGARGTF